MPVIAVSDSIKLECAWRPRGADADTVPPPDPVDEPPILLITGMAGTMHAWGEPFLSSLAEGADLLRYGHRGVGRSTRVEEQFTIRDLAADALGLLAALGIGRAHVVGASMGGMVAQELVLTAPEVVETLTLGCTYPGGDGAQVMSDETAAKLFGSKAAGRDAAVRASWEANLGSTFREADDGTQWRRFRDMALHEPVAVPVIVRQASAIAMHDVQSRLSSITTPTLVVHGTDDEILPFHNGEIIAGAIPGARFEVFDEVGHLWWWEQPERSARLIRDHVGAA